VWALGVVKRLASLPLDHNVLQLHPPLISNLPQVLVVGEVRFVSI
jgi:hypothetical protein